MDSFLFVDFTRCIACHACETACGREHGGAGRLYVMRFENAAVPLACRQCEAAPCVAMCPEDALVYDEGSGVGLVVERCTRCGLCVAACPFGVMRLGAGPGGDPVRCDRCRRRREEGRLPVCVLTCPTQALSVQGRAVVQDRRRIHFTGLRVS
ncbi:formate dehydrogenase iron-sulfur subunit [Desulfacinum hydrothermale DSM 13146]|uniref:Formate dehydrogenase iron-sulfur subunit n=1 Tax=Desulfacinum hydrothermale DSM 13146 TaxID=1121390 RepID=A0A1W1XC37_9BACT|nr:4Fe-4S dicluster domain-containing protein [Desulfacinum hydrothermale]SMC21516.1 formate dehydrogenase iron-sulfur subunit [Desulfacinum hydrothermale DSM 13146]